MAATSAMRCVHVGPDGVRCAVRLPLASKAYELWCPAHRPAMLDALVVRMRQEFIKEASFSYDACPTCLAPLEDGQEYCARHAPRKRRATAVADDDDEETDAAPTTAATTRHAAVGMAAQAAAAKVPAPAARCANRDAKCTNAVAAPNLFCAHCAAKATAKAQKS
jgi:hypothetical protein